MSHLMCLFSFQQPSGKIITVCNDILPAVDSSTLSLKNPVIFIIEYRSNQIIRILVVKDEGFCPRYPAKIGRISNIIREIIILYVGIRIITTIVVGVIEGIFERRFSCAGLNTLDSLTIQLIIRKIQF